MPVSSSRSRTTRNGSHPDKQLDVYEAVIRGNGWRKAVVVLKQRGFHRERTRHLAHGLAHRLEDPVETQEYASLAEEPKTADCAQQCSQTRSNYARNQDSY